MVDTLKDDKALFPERAGDRLRAARTSAGMDLSDVASRTRIPLRHLQAIEAGDYSSFPSSTYCVGFVKAYARAVGENEAELSRQVRIELGQDAHGYRTELQDYDDADPARIPSRTLAWTAAAAFLLVATGYGVWRTQILSGPEVGQVQSVLAETSRPSVAPVAPGSIPPNTKGEVALTAIEPVWVRIYDAADKVLFEKEMAKGERFVVPPDADNPRVRTGRAELIAVTINGSAVPALGPGERTVKDVGISAAALLARPPVDAQRESIVARPASIVDQAASTKTESTQVKTESSAVTRPKPRSAGTSSKPAAARDVPPPALAPVTPAPTPENSAASPVGQP